MRDRPDRRGAAPIEHLREVGWAAIEGFFTPAECDTIAAAAAARQWPELTGPLARWTTDRRWAPLATGLLGPDVRFVREQVLTKAPHSQAEVPWHQDSGYAPIDGEFLTAIVALEDMTVANGCLCVAPGSHLAGPVAHVPSGYVLEIADPVEPRGTVVPQAKGTLLTFSSFTHHRSGANATSGTRPAWLVQFCRADALDTRTGELLEAGRIVASEGAWIEPSRADEQL